MSHLLLDENIDQRLVRLLVESGFEVQVVTRGGSDAQAEETI